MWSYIAFIFLNLVFNNIFSRLESCGWAAKWRGFFLLPFVRGASAATARLCASFLRHIWRNEKETGGALRTPPSSHVSVPDSFLQCRSSSRQNVPCPGAPIGSDPAWTGSDVPASGKCTVSPQNIIHNILLCQRRRGVRAIPVQTTCFDSKRTKWYGSATDHFSSNHTKLFVSVLSKIRRPPTPFLSVTTSAPTFSHGFEVTDCCFGQTRRNFSCLVCAHWSVTATVWTAFCAPPLFLFLRGWAACASLWHLPTPS